VRAEVVSAARTIAFLRLELELVDRSTAAAQLYAALVDALERVYQLQRCA
jgi:hypothetical protein